MTERAFQNVSGPRSCQAHPHPCCCNQLPPAVINKTENHRNSRWIHNSFIFTLQPSELQSSKNSYKLQLLTLQMVSAVCHESDRKPVPQFSFIFFKFKQKWLWYTLGNEHHHERWETLWEHLSSVSCFLQVNTAKLRRRKLFLGLMFGSLLRSTNTTLTDHSASEPRCRSR